MGMTRYTVDIIKNGESIYDEEFKFFAGKSLYDAISEILSADEDAKAITSYTHFNVNGTTKTIDDLKGMSINSDVSVELLSKSTGGC